LDQYARPKSSAPEVPSASDVPLAPEVTTLVEEQEA
jgi:hypothetical protein